MGELLDILEEFNVEKPETFNKVLDATNNTGQL